MTMKYPQKVKVAVLPFGDLMRINTSVEGKMEFSGVEGEILNVALNFLGFQYGFMIPEDLQWGRPEKDGNWSGLVGMIQRDEADLAFSYLSMTEERSKVIGYSKPYMFEEHTFISQMPPNRKSTLTFLYPFDLPTWICLFLTLVLMSTLLAMFKNGIRSLGINFFKLFASLVKQAVNTDGGSRKYNMLVAFWLLFAHVIVLSYSSTLLSFLIKPLKEVPVRNFNELSRAVQGGNYQANFTNFSLSFLLNSNMDHLVKLGEIVSSNKWIANTSALSSETVIKPKFFLALNKNLAKSYFGTRNDLFFSEDRLFTSYLAFGYNKRFCCVSKLNTFISRISQAGLYGKYLHDRSMKLFFKTLKRSIKSNTETPLSFDDLISEFTLLIVGLSLSFVIFLAEIVYSRFVSV
ncbi:hypothetical protein AVEN_219406-1 [Araneus ventricosus]|uniref:Ionotropic glutamate receptor L-glutamate and glycine-binding domain-containing protein n=1 Tax=Araneus ventricosus TaxID=182803 RepID=A0A4Y2IMR6_ARAVE|nr:hypothetical protein AVEN_141090-1 [Araneus ventricosus]GBM79142.1 hypothetical protein AVEN_219406-1 [Araneus ventricosus]